MNLQDIQPNISMGAENMLILMEPVKFVLLIIMILMALFSTGSLDLEYGLVQMDIGEREYTTMDSIQITIEDMDIGEGIIMANLGATDNMEALKEWDRILYNDNGCLIKYERIFHTIQTTKYLIYLYIKSFYNCDDLAIYDNVYRKSHPKEFLSHTIRLINHNYTLNDFATIDNDSGKIINSSAKLIDDKIDRILNLRLFV
jgi:hypothetical protein